MRALKVTHFVTLHMTAPTVTTIHAVQGDGARMMAASLMEWGGPWEVPEGTSAGIGYTLPDKSTGYYDRLEDGSPAAMISGNLVTAVLAPVLTQQAGTVKLSLILRQGEQQIATFPLQVRVQKAAGRVTGEAVTPQTDGFDGKIYYGGPGGTLIPLGIGDGVRVETAEDGSLVLVSEGGGGGGGILQEKDPTVPQWAKQPQKPAYTAKEVGLGNVADERQYSAQNPPPYPVRSVNGQTGGVIIEVPTKLSALTNDTGFVTNAVTDLQNYYTKQQTEALIATIPKFRVEVVSALPAVGQEEILYLVPFATAEGQYLEYIWVGGRFEVIGSQRVDLSGYATETWVQEYVAEAIQEQPGGVYYIATDYGISPGNDDNTPAMQALIDQVAEAGGGVIWIPAGEYRFRRSGQTWDGGEYALIPRNNVSVIGEGIRATVLKMVDPAPYGLFLNRATAKEPWAGATFERFTVDAYDTQTSEYGYKGKAFHAKYVKDCVFRDLVIRGTTGTGLGIDFLDRVRIDNVSCIDCGRTYTGSEPGHSGIGIGTGGWENENFTISNCVAVGCGQYGIFIENQLEQFGSGNVGLVKGAVISDCIVRDGLNKGIGIRGGGHVTVIGCESYGNASDGYYVDGLCRDVHLMSCSGSGNGRNGIRINPSEGSARVVAEGCQMSGNTGAGIRVGTALTGLVIQSCHTAGNALGIEFNGQALQDAVIWGNAFADGSGDNAEFAGKTGFNQLVGEDSEQNVTIDTTLTVEGAAADAKAVGDALGNTQPKGLYVKTVNGAAPDAAGNVNFTVTAPDGSIAVDPTLSVGGAAADAAAVGAAIAKQADIIYGPGKNIIDASKVIYAGNGRIHDTTGELMSGSTWVFGDYDLTPGETYTISKTKGSQFLCFYNADGSYAGLANRISVSANTLTFVAPAPMMRIMAYSDIATINLQIEAGDTATEYEVFGYALKEGMRVTDPNVVENLLAPGKVDNRYVADKNLALQKMNFAIATYNLVDPLACVAGYLSTAGNIMQSSAFLATDYIPVSADDGYVRTVGDWVSCAFYNASKGFLSIVKGGNSAPIPANAAYVRVDWNGFLDNAARYCVYVGAEEKPYIPYRVISQKFVEQAEDAFPEVRLVLPRDVYVANGVRVDIHAQSITRGIDVRNLVKPIATSNGAYRAVYNHLEITGGEKTDRSFDVYCETTWGKFALKNISVHNVPAAAGAGMTKRILFIGDSKTDAGVYTQCLMDMFADDSMSIQLLGTRGTADNRHEGRSGWSARNYVLNDAYRGVIEDSPFYNPTTHAFDFGYYMDRNGYDGVDFVFINLGTNDADDSANFISYYNTMIDGIRSYNPNVIIGIWVPAPFATFGGYSHADNDAQTFDMMEAIIAEFDTPENQANRIFVVPTHMNLNTEYDYPWRDEPYTREKPEHTYRVCTDQIHEVYGYYKDANVIFGYIKHFATL